MKKILNSLQTKLIISFTLLIIIIAGGTFIFTFGQTKKALLDITRDDMLQVIGMASTQFSPEEIGQIEQLKEGQDNAPEYLAFQKKLQDMRAISPNVVNFYIMRIDGEKITFLVDDAEDSPAKIAEEYEQPDPRLFDAVTAPAVSDNIYTDEYGTYLSGYAPVKNADGTTAFVIGADMLATKVLERQNFIGNTIYLIMGLAILIAALIIGVFSLTIIRDINKLNAAAEKISMGDTNVSMDVKRNDEIGELANSFARMVASLKIMMMTDEPSDDSSNSSDLNQAD
jgi:HAMP domain-containing protein